jgi:hypothetical protein
MLHLVRSRRTLRPALSLARLVGGGALALFALSCGDDGEYWGEGGSYSHAYTCISMDDLACEDAPGSLTTGLPRVVAVGGRFKLSYYSGLPASPLMIERNGDELQFIRPGYGAILGSSGGASGFVHLKAAHVASLELDSSLDISGGSEVAVNGRVRLTATPYDAEGERLAGLVRYRWSVDDESVVHITRAGRTIELTALSPGVATVRVEVGTQAFATYTAQVVQSPFGPTPIVDSGTGDTDEEQNLDAGLTWDGGAIGSSDVNLDGGTTSEGADSGNTSVDASVEESSSLTDAASDGGQL